MFSGQDIICFGIAEWDNPYRTNQHYIMEQLSKDNRILFIESLGLRAPLLQKKDIKRILKRLIKGISGVKKVLDNLFVYSPLIIPFHKYKLIRKLNNFFLKIFISYYIRKYKFSSLLIWTYTPTIVEILPCLRYKMLIYHCVDELSGNPHIPYEIVVNLEKELLKVADVVFTTSNQLYESKSKYNSNTFYLPNVADFNHFSKSLLPETPVAEDITKIPKPVVGFIGAISSYKIDFSLINYIAEKKPQWSIVLIGDLGEGEKAVDIHSTFRYRNIYFLGPRKYSVLPQYLKYFDVCLLPNVINKYTENMFPMKFFEYLSSGKPVVATNLPSLKEFSELCYISSTYDEFIENISLALNEPKILQSKRIELAKGYTWEKRIETMSQIIFEILEKKGSVS